VVLGTVCEIHHTREYRYEFFIYFCYFDIADVLF